MLALTASHDGTQSTQLDLGYSAQILNEQVEATPSLEGLPILNTDSDKPSTICHVRRPTASYLQPA